MKRVRDLVSGSLGTLPVAMYGPTQQSVGDWPLFIQPESDLPRSVTMIRTVEDLLFEGIAYWRVIQFGWHGYPTKIRRLDPRSVTIRKNQKAYLRRDGSTQGMAEEELPEAELIIFHSPNDPLLVAGARAIRTCLQLDAAAARSAASPMPQGIFTPAEGADPAEDDDVVELMAAWKSARQKNADAYVPAALKYNALSWNPKDLQLAEARQHAVLEIARLVGVDPEDLGVSTTSRTYQNSEDRKKAFLDDVLGPYLHAIEDRLGMNDVTPRGYYTRFNLDAYLRSDTLTRYQAYQIGLEVGAITHEEIRELEDRPPLSAEQLTQLRETPALPAAPTAQEDIEVNTFSSPMIELKLEAQATGSTFSVDRESRTITGLAVPYGKTARSGGKLWQFSKGTLVFSDVSRVKLLAGHDWKQAVGKATSLEETDAGLMAKFSVARGPEGDRALTLAEDGVWDGLSVGVAQGGIYSEKNGVMHAIAAPLAEISLTPCPAFDDARVQAVAASSAFTGKEIAMECDKCGHVHAAGVVECTTPPATFDLSSKVVAALTADQAKEQIKALFDEWSKPKEGDLPPRETVGVVTPQFDVKEELPYKFDRGGNFLPTEHVFSADLHEMARARDEFGDRTEAGKRVMALIKATFDVDTTDVATVNPTIQRPDMYVDQRDYRTPLWNFITKGAPPNGVQPFAFPKFSSSSGLVGDHTQGTEPTSGTFVTTNQTITPTPTSGKASITREVWDMGGNPAVSGLIFNQMVRGWKEGLETATATFLNTLTAATDITLTAGAVDDDLAAAWDAAVADLQFIRGYDFEAFAVEKALYKTFVAAVDSTGRKLFPQINPTNANGTSSRRFTQLDLAGVTGVPSWALPSTPGSPNNSWLFDPSTVHGWASAPQRLEFPGTDASGNYAPVAMVDLAIWGYKAFANSDLGGVRQVIYDTTA
ncbi:phage portal protein [Kribbella jiaozuonensis]|uniref:phage portal protein n=1 Tax=Kribbella jiaozuonensis TaxID=2575441 RepID=UPI001484F924|nr:phage portal protein [Kribbella jiaozuonensis]